MSLQSRPPIVPFLPESAPFTEEQRAWLNGFFAGIFSGDAPAGATALSAGDAAALMPELKAADAPEDDGAPWHDPSMPMAERMALAEGKALPRRLMAAMAQQDCGQCGYVCETYAAAIAAGAEPKLNLCAPGGKETLRMLKQLTESAGAAPAPAAPAAAEAKTAPAPPGTRDNPGTVTFLGRRRLNKEGSEKETFHIDFDLEGSGLDYAAGDSFGIFPANDPALVDQVIAAIHAPEDFPIAGKTLRAVLTHEVCLKAPPDALFQLVSYLVGGARKETAKRLAAGEDPDGDAALLDVLAALEKFPGIRPDPEAFIECLEPLQPRLYSISSSPAATPGLLSLTVDKVRFEAFGRERRGVASTFLGAGIPEGTKLKAYIQKAHGFGLPQDPAKSVIMVGPGTGIAPFRAFLHERAATRAPGGNWLFFGHQRRETDFFYEEELAAFQAQGVLTRLDTAWSRDGAQKVYVQDRIRAAGAELWAWLNGGAHVYICGDAKRMAKDVEAALADVAAAHGGLGPHAAAAFLADLKKAGRFQADVY